MLLQTNIELKAGIYKATLYVVTLSTVEKEALARFPEPTIELGGEIPTEGAPFTLPPNQRLFPSQFPAIKSWAYSVENGQYAEAWLTEIKTRVVDAVTELLGQDIGPVGITQTTYNIPPS
jgi:hypothetical protein